MDSPRKGAVHLEFFRHLVRTIAGLFLATLRVFSPMIGSQFVELGAKFFEALTVRRLKATCSANLGIFHRRADGAAMFKRVSLFAGNSNIPLATSIASHLEIPLSKSRTTRFSDGESFVEINENVRGVDAFVIQSTGSPVNDNVMKL